jgi:hypothetical protein
VRGSRAVGIVLRTAHLLAMAVFVGGLQLDAAEPAIRAWRIATVATGIGLLAVEMSHGRAWIHQVRGLTAVAHVAVLGLLAFGGMGRPASAIALVIGAVGSHLPRSIRKYSVRDRRVLD